MMKATGLILLFIGLAALAWLRERGMALNGHGDSAGGIFPKSNPSGGAGPAGGGESLGGHGGANSSAPTTAA